LVVGVKVLDKAARREILAEVAEVVLGRSRESVIICLENCVLAPVRRGGRDVFREFIFFVEVLRKALFKHFLIAVYLGISEAFSTFDTFLKKS